MTTVVISQERDDAEGNDDHQHSIPQHFEGCLFIPGQEDRPPRISRFIKHFDLSPDRVSINEFLGLCLSCQLGVKSEDTTTFEFISGDFVLVIHYRIVRSLVVNSSGGDTGFSDCSRY